MDGVSGFSNPDPLSVREEVWAVAEESTREVLDCVHPTLDSEEKRRDVVDYVQRLIKRSIGCEVFSYGSVPLKTYLPDGDIDLTALSSPNLDESLAHDVLAVMREEEQNENAEFEVRDTQFIDAEVKLVKCLIRNIVIDISFNQLGGLCTLCFLEQVDRLVGKNHLFKRSIILIKTWCYYESRILGAHHGLISTYALETLILYILHLFHSSLDGPLAVFYRFLDYYSKFDWENYCISLNGPVSKSSLPDIDVKLPEKGGCNPMLSEEFLRNCVEMFSIQSRGTENKRAFLQKHLNIIDPLKENNNLGRSVHRSNFYRIRSAFKHGARRLGQILCLPRERVATEIKKFFCNTFQRHGRNYVADLGHSAPTFGADCSITLSLSSPTEVMSEDDDSVAKSSTGDFDDEILGLEDRNELENNMAKFFQDVMSEVTSSGDGIAFPHNGDTNDLAAFTSMSSSSNDTCDCSSSSNCSDSFSGQYSCIPRNHFPVSSALNGNCGTENVSGSDPSDCYSGSSASGSWVDQRVNYSKTNGAYSSCTNNHNGSAVSRRRTNSSDCQAVDVRETDLASVGGDTEALNPLIDLSGDYDSHIRSLLYGQCCHGFALSTAAKTNPPSSPSWYQNRGLWSTVCLSMPVRQSSFAQRSSNAYFAAQPNYPASKSAPSSTCISSVKQKPQGTGTYIPKVVLQDGAQTRRDTKGRGRIKEAASDHQLQSNASNGLAPALSRAQFSKKGCHDNTCKRYLGEGHGRSSVLRQSNRSLEGGALTDSFSSSSGRIEIGSLVVDLTSGSPHTRESKSEAVFKSQGVKTGPGKVEKDAVESFHPRTDDEFPPLSL